MESVELAELESLMNEFPDWKSQYPQLYSELNPPRYSKNRGPAAYSYDASSLKQKRATTVPKTDYQATYTSKFADGHRPRSTKRPPPTARDPNPPHMSFDTWQRSEYVPKDFSGRAKLVKMESDRYVPPHEPFPAKSYYQEQFSSYNVPEVVLRPPPKSTLIRSEAKMQDVTTSREHYKKWQPDPVITFRDPPSFTGSILYPQRATRLPESTNTDTYKYQYSERPELAKLTGVNIKSEGEMDLNTVTRLTYKKFDGARPAQRVTHDPTMPAHSRGKFQAETQAMRDFPGYQGRQPRPARPSVPAPATIDLKFDDRTFFKTEMQNEFTGIDTTKHLVARGGKKPDEYQPSSAKFDGLTNQKNDYRPYDLKEAYIGPVKPQQRRMDNVPRLDDTTTNKVHFKKYDVQPRVRHGDFHEAHKYIPPSEKFEGTSTNQDVFTVPKGASIPPSFKPEDKPVASSGVQDFNTVYRKCYTEPHTSQKLDATKAKFLLAELRKRRQQKGGAQHSVLRGLTGTSRHHPIPAN